MKTVLKVLAWFVGIAVLAGAAMVVFLTMFVDPNEYREDIARLVEKQTGRRLTIAGDLNLTFFPWLGVQTGRLELANPPGFDKTNMLTVEAAEIRVKLVPLLTQQFEVDTIVLKKPSVHLIVKTDGTSNWQDLAKTGSADGDPAQPAGAVGALAVEGVDLTGGKLIWEDRRGRSTFLLNQVDLKTGEVLSGDPVDVELSLVLSSNDLDHPLAVALDATVSMDLPGQRLEVRDANLRSDYGPSSKGEMRFATLRYELDTTRLTVESIQVDGTYASPDLAQPVAATIKTALSADLKANTVQLGESEVLGGYGPDGKAEVRFSSLNYDIAGNKLKANGLQLEGIYAGAGVAQPVKTNLASVQVAADLGGGVFELGRSEMRGSYGPGGAAEGSFTSVRYDQGANRLEATGLQLDGQYAGPEVAQPVNAKLASARAAAELSRGVLELGQSEIEGDYGSDGKAKARFQALRYDLTGSVLESARVEVDASYAELDQPLAATVSTALKLDLSNGRYVLGKASGKAGYGDVGNADFSADALDYNQNGGTFAAAGLTVDGKYGIHDFVANVPELTAEFNQQKLAAPAVVARVDGVEAEANLELSDFLDNVKYRGGLQTEPFKPGELLKRFGIAVETRDASALAVARVSTRFEGGLDHIKLDKLTARVDDTNIKGAVAVEDFAKPRYRFDISLDSIDVDRYAPPSDGAETSGVETGAAIIVLPVGLFRELDVNGDLAVGQLKVSGVRATDIQVSVSSTPDGMTVKPMRAELYNGTLEGEMRFRQQADRATLVLHQEMDRVDIGPLLSDTQVTDRIDGRGRLVVDVTAEESGDGVTTRGTAAFRFTDGAIRGVDLRKLYLQARQIYEQERGREQTVESDDREEFRFTEMDGTLVFNERIATNDDLNIKSPLFRVNGNGSADLVANQLDYLVNATVVESAKGQGGEELSELKGVNIPIRITGSLHAPVYSLDVGRLVQGLVQKQVEKEAEKLEKKLEKKLEEKLGEELQKLFN